MASDVPLLAYLTKYAQEDFPDVFKIVHNSDLYTFRQHTLEDDLTVKMVLAGSYDMHRNTRGRKPLWAYTEDENVQYYLEEDFHLLWVDKGVHALYPDEGPVRHKDGPAPFNLVAPSRWPSTKNVKQDERKRTRARFECLVRFAYILTGRVHSIGDNSHANLLGQLKDLCMDLSENDIEKSLPAKRVVNDEDETAQSMQEQFPATRARRRMPPQLGSTINKRTAADMEGATAEQGVRNIRSRITDMSLSPSPHDRIGRNPPTLQPVQQSIGPRETFDKVVDLIMAQKSKEWAQEQAASEKELELLKAQLLDEKNKLQECNE